MKNFTSIKPHFQLKDLPSAFRTFSVGFRTSIYDLFKHFWIEVNFIN